MSKEPAWSKYVKFPSCAQCDGRGFFVNPKTGWPEECPRCKSGRESAIAQAQAEVRRQRKTVG